MSGDDCNGPDQLYISQAADASVLGDIFPSQVMNFDYKELMKEVIN